MAIAAFDQTRIPSKIPFLKHCLAILGFFVGFYILWFSPSLLSGQLLGPGDGYIQSIPAYYAARTLWTTHLLGGFPVAADVTPQTWYPLSLLLSIFPHSWNVFVISSYVLASAFAYAYVHLITRSVLASLVAGITYGASGFMMAHLGHTSMIHTATWIPLPLLLIEQLLRSRRKIWVALLAIGIACLFLAGHPQISVYGLGLASLYALFFGGLSASRWSFYRLYALAVMVGLGLTAIQLVPTLELARMTPRSAMSFGDFLAFSMPLSHAVMTVFPYIFGGGNVTPYRIPYIGVASPTEITIYMGLLPLTFALLGGRARNYSQSFRYFWLGVALASFLLILGGRTPMAWLSYQIPGYNKFRVLGRHGIELAMAVSVLAGLGVSAVQQPQFKWPQMKQLLQQSFSIMGLMLFWAIIACSYFWQTHHLTHPPETALAFLSVLTHPPETALAFLSVAILPSLGIFILGLVSLCGFVRYRSTAAAIFLLTVLTIDMSAFGWFYQWQDSPSSQDTFNTPPFLQKYQATLEQQHQRFFPLQGGLGKNSEVPPNLSRLWNAPSMSGYGPLLISRVGEFMSLTPPGTLSSSAPLIDSNNLSLDLTAVRYITTTAPNAQLALVGDDGTKWSHENLDLSFGTACVVEPRSEMTITLAKQVEIDSISLVGTLGCSTTLTQGTNALELRTQNRSGKSESHFLKAGIDLSEWAIECPLVTAQTQHQKATVFQQSQIGEQNCAANFYVTKVQLDRPTSVNQLQLRLPTENMGSVNIRKISFNNSQTKVSHPLLGGRLQHVENIGETSIYENQQAMPRAWLASQVQTARPDQILAAVKTAKLPNGERFNPRNMALIEEPTNFPIQLPDPNATVQVEFPSETQVRLQANSNQPAFLVLSDVFYPGWQAHIDGQRTHIFQTDYILRGINLPPGQHTVTFSFRPRSFAIGCGVSGAAFALLLYLVVSDRQGGKTTSTPT